MNNLRPGIPSLPDRIKRLPIDERGYPVPWFVSWIDGKPEFRAVDSRKIIRAVRESLCWICGNQLGVYFAFVIGPMCAINRTSGEPPSHRECAEFAAKACPFLTTPKERRREINMPENSQMSPTGITRNPGVALVWITKSFSMIQGLSGEPSFKINDPTETLWFCEGRKATRIEVLTSVETGLPLLREMAEKDGAGAIEHLERLYREAERYYPSL